MIQLGGLFASAEDNRAFSYEARFPLILTFSLGRNDAVESAFFIQNIFLHWGELNCIAVEWREHTFEFLNDLQPPMAGFFAPDCQL